MNAREMQVARELKRMARGVGLVGAHAHHPGCQMRAAIQCAVGLECIHGYDVCPICDPCNCEELLGGS